VGVLAYLADVIQNPKECLEFIIMTIAVILMTVLQRLAYYKTALILGLGVWVYNHLRNIYFAYDDLYEDTPQSNYLWGYTFGALHVMCHSSFSHTLIKIGFEIFAIILKIIYFFPDAEVDACIAHSICIVFLCIAHILTDYNNKKFYFRLESSRNALLKFKEFLANYLPGGLLIVDGKNTNILFTNASLYSLFEISKEEDCQKKLNEIKVNVLVKKAGDASTDRLHSPDTENMTLKEYIHEYSASFNENSQIKSFYTNSKKEKVTCEVSLRQITWDGKQVQALIFRDISHQEAMIALQIANQNQEKALAIVAHELRNPINGLLGVTKMMENQFSNENQILKPLSLIKVNISIILNLLNSMLDMEQLKQNTLNLNISKVKISELFENIRSLYEYQLSSKNLKFFTKIESPKAKYIYTDKNRLNQILINLVANALKFTFKGSITVSVQEDPEDSEKLLFKVTDTGIGIKDEDCNHLFQMFGKLQSSAMINPEGVGLGLVISNSLVKALNNNNAEDHIKVESKYGEGSTFYFSITNHQKDSIITESEISLSDLTIFKQPVRGLHINQNHLLSIATRVSSAHYSDLKVDKPLLEDEIKYLNYMEETNNFALPNSKIALIVDDNIFNFIAAKELLEPHGFVCYYVEDGKYVLPKIEELLEESLHVDFIFMDCEMPIMNGYQATSLIREKINNEELYEMTIVGLTGNTGENAEKECIEAGMDMVITKPITEEKINVILQNYKL